MLKSTSSSTSPRLSPSSDSLSPHNQANKAPPSGYDLLAQVHPHHHPTLVFPFPSCYHFHARTHAYPSSPPYALPSASIGTAPSDAPAARSEFICKSLSSHGFSKDSHCYTNDCSPRSVIRHVHSSSSGPSPDPCRPSSSYSTQSNSHNLAATSGFTSRPDFAATYGRTGICQFHGQHDQTMMKITPDCFPSSDSPDAARHHQCLHANTDRSTVASGLLPNVNYTHHEAESDYSKNQQRKERSLSRVISSTSSGEYTPASAAVDKTCTNVELKEPNGWTDGLHHAGVAFENTLRGAPESKYVSSERLQRHTEASAVLGDPLLPSILAEHEQRLQENRSHSCDLHNGGSAQQDTLRRSTKPTLQEGQSHSGNASPNCADVRLDYPDRMTNRNDNPSLKGGLQLGSKWEDAEKWLRPTSNGRQHHPTGCRGLVPSLALLRMSDCTNARNATKQQLINPARLDARCAACCFSAHTNCTFLSPLEYCMTHSLHPTFMNSTSDLQYEFSSAEVQANVLVNPPPVGTSQYHHGDCFRPQAISCTPDFAYIKEYCAGAELSRSRNQTGKRGQASKQMSAHPQPLQDDGAEESNQHHQFYNQDNSGSCISHPIHARARHTPTLVLATSTISLPHPKPPKPCMASQLRDRFAGGQCLPSSSTQLVCRKTDNKSTLMGPGIQESVAIPMVSLREVGTQMSSIDGSGSISRYTSKNGSPQKLASPTRHNTPAKMRSLAGSASNSGNVRRNAKQFINLEELVECHRAKLELQALSEGERIHSFHRTTSNWSSQEVEEADLSRSLRHSTPELENESATSLGYKWPSQSYSWNKEDATKLVKLQLKEAQIKAWEEKKKSKADAKLRRLEENLAKKRSQTTARVMASLAAAQRKAEEMRATVYAQHRKQGKNSHRFHPRSLSPLRQCTCFSVWQ